VLTFFWWLLLRVGPDPDPKPQVPDPDPQSFRSLRIWIRNTDLYKPLELCIQYIYSTLFNTYTYTGCEGYWRPFLKVDSCLSHVHHSTEIFAGKPSHPLLHRPIFYLMMTNYRHLQESPKESTITRIRAGRPNNKAGYLLERIKTMSRNKNSRK
jgi:hypothetical protein